jgi:O-antigen ligase
MNFQALSVHPGKTLPYLAPGLFLLALPITHTVALRLLTLVITFVMAAVVYTRGEREKPPCLAVWLLWLGAALLSLASAVDLDYSLREIKTEIGYGILAFSAFFILTRRWQHFVTLSAIMLIGFWILSCAALFDSLTGSSWNMTGFYGGVGDFSTYQITLLPVLLLLAYFQYQKRPALTLSLGALSTLLFLLTALMTMNLMLWISLILQLLTLLFLGLRQHGRLKLTVALLSMVIALSGLVSVGVMKGRIPSLTPQGLSAMFKQDVRVAHWSRVTDIIAQQPFRGDGFGRATLGKAHPEVLTRPALWHSHNLFLDAAIQMGIQGALILALLFVCLSRQFLGYRIDQNRDLHAIGVVGMVLIVGILSKSMTDNFFQRHLSLLFWAEAGMLLGLARRLARGQIEALRLSASPSSSPAAL